MHFYELHEGDGDDFGDLLLFRDEEMDPEDFFELVQTIRERVLASFGEPTLIEAIAVELERNHGFIFVSDDRLTAAVNVSRIDKENFLADLDAVDDEDRDDDDEDADQDGDEDRGEDADEDAGEGLGGDFRSILADFDPRGRVDPN